MTAMEQNHTVSSINEEANSLYTPNAMHTSENIANHFMDFTSLDRPGVTKSTDDGLSPCSTT